MLHQKHQSAVPQEAGHIYLVNPVTLARQFVSIFLIVLVLFLAMWMANGSGMLPKKSQLDNADSAIISTKARMATTSNQKRIAFVGDSSCLVNIHIPTMKDNGIEAINLGTLSFLGIDSFGLLAQRFCQDKPDTQIFLVLHPECIRMVESSSEHRKILMEALDQSTDGSTQFELSKLRRITVDDFSSRLFNGWLPTPIKGQLGYRYGFTHNLRNEIFAAGGFMEETGRFGASVSLNSSEYRIARRIQSECTLFRSYLPKGVKVRLLVSPIPQSHATRGHEKQVREMQSEIEKWIQADNPSVRMPSVLSDSNFGTVTHLLPNSAREYTRQLCLVLSQ
jgi:hypothetical protein